MLPFYVDARDAGLLTQLQPLPVNVSINAEGYPTKP